MRVYTCLISAAVYCRRFPSYTRTCINHGTFAKQLLRTHLQNSVINTNISKQTRMNYWGRKSISRLRNPWRIERSIVLRRLYKHGNGRQEYRQMEGHLWRKLVQPKKYEYFCKFAAAMNMRCLPYNPFLKFLRTSTREVLGFMRRGYLEAVLPRENAGMDGPDGHVTTDWQVHAVLYERKIQQKLINKRNARWIIGFLWNQSWKCFLPLKLLATTKRGYWWSDALYFASATIIELYSSTNMVRRISFSGILT